MEIRLEKLSPSITIGTRSPTQNRRSTMFATSTCAATSPRLPPTGRWPTAAVAGICRAKHARGARGLPHAASASPHHLKGTTNDDDIRAYSDGDQDTRLHRSGDYAHANVCMNPSPNPANGRRPSTSGKSFEALFDHRQRRELHHEWNHPDAGPETFFFPEDVHTPVPWRCCKCGGRWSTSLQHRLRQKDQGVCPHCCASP